MTGFLTEKILLSRQAQIACTIQFSFRFAAKKEKDKSMKSVRAHSILSACLLTLLVSTNASLHAWPAFARETKAKYGPEATLLSHAHEYVAHHPAPDFWALIPYYTAQQTGAACSIASVTMIINGARSGQKLSADEQLATQDSVLKKTGDEAWTKAVGSHGFGVTLDQLGKYTEEAFKAYGFPKVHVTVVHTEDTSPATEAKLHQALIQNEKSANDFILINFIQGAYTGDADVGHIAPIAAFDAQADRALVMDPDREWYEPYWVSEKTLLKGMATKDPVSGKNRGYIWVQFGK
jgi:hypothetical protein